MPNPGHQVPGDGAEQAGQHDAEAGVGQGDDAAADGLGHLPATSGADEVDPAAMTSAMRGVSARVETLVAIALAASWKPLV